MKLSGYAGSYPYLFLNHTRNETNIYFGNTLPYAIFMSSGL
jgi:hypothetical protein